MSAQELSALEFELLGMLKWDVGVDTVILQGYFDSLLRSYGEQVLFVPLKLSSHDQIEKGCRSVKYLGGFTTSQPNDRHPVPLQS